VRQRGRRGPQRDVVVTSLPSAAALVDVLDGEGGLHGRGRPELVVVETSTLSE
jgi:putative dehydrogenase